MIEDVDIEEYAVLQGSFNKLVTMADGTVRVTLDLDCNLTDAAKLGFERGMPVAIARITGQAALQDTRRREQRDEKPTYGNYARKLKLSGFFRSPLVWRALGSDDEYLEWLRDQLCAYCGWEPHWEMDTFVRCEAAHRRRANNSGTAHKPEFDAIALCRKCHHLQHQEGESALGGKEWFDRQRIKHVETWAWVRMRDLFKVESMREVPPESLGQWAAANDLTHLLPRGE